MSSVLFASVVRVGDGLPLSASTDYEHDRELHDTRKHLKALSKKLPHFPDRCTFASGPYNVNFTSALGVCYMMVCLSSYPSVLAFCFLDELQKEFLVTYDSKRVAAAVRPYSFIQFDVVIQRTKHRYNSPRSLSTKINMADMQTELKLRPPYRLTPDDLQAANGFSPSRSSAKYKGIAPSQTLEPVTLPGAVSCVLSVLCGGLNLLRGVHAIESVLQCFLFAYFSVWRNVKSFLALGLVCVCNMYLFQLRNVWQILFHVAVAACMTLHTHLRRPLGKAPDYNV
ncbi:vesicle-trafficking protein SEC22a isoform X2 [Phyllopteryx taeniolatus]|uniref:vesicle-trafficking protein SEC22a isoform X2 n=1 Tax=Phyllopteryx taeniolatus TaxID=161469 RepID=UPI002AD44286|nr:vesicle-trafficking protein SEC22a isoform X2 [Phyllopteryx taeniolatus]